MIAAGKETPCVVLDVSSAGARLCISSARVPRAFNLRFHGQTYGCALAWQKEMEIGVTFSSTPLGDATPTDAPAPAPSHKVDIRGLRSQLFGKGASGH
jgi:hypothetical protein